MAACSLGGALACKREESQASYAEALGVVAAMAASADEAEAKSLSQQRRRLSVASDNKFIEGVESMSLGRGGRRGSSIAIREGEAGSHISRLHGVSKKGYAPYNPRKKNQDALAMIEDEVTGTQAILVLDGHGEAGDQVSGYYKEKYIDEVFSRPEWAEGVEGMKASIEHVLRKLEKELINNRNVDTEFSGSTYVFACLRGGSLLVANVGDSRVTLGVERADGRVVAEAVSVDHKPELPAEKARIVAAGGRVFAVEYDDGIDGPNRVWLGHMDVPGLAMSRSVGDVVAHTAGVTTDPEFFERELTHADRFLVSATDGLWEFMTDDEVVTMVATIATETGSPKACVEALVEESNARWMKNEQVIDDTTIAVAFLSADLVAAAEASSKK